MQPLARGIDDACAGGPDGRSSAAWALLPAGLAALIGGWGIGRRPLWLDEVTSACVASHSFGHLKHYVLEGELNMAAYNVLLWLTSEPSDPLGRMRLLSLAFFVGACALTCLLGREYATPRVALTAGLMVAANSFAIRYGQELRSYSMYLFLVTLAAWLLVRGLRRGSTPTLLAGAWVAGAAFYAHVFALFLAAALLGPLALLAARGLRRGDVLWAWGVAAATPAPGILAVALSRQRGQAGWIPPWTLDHFWRTSSDLAGAGGTTLAIPMLLLATAGLVALSRARGRPLGRWPAWLLASWIALPLAASVLLQAAWRPFAVSRYFLPAAVPLALLAAEGLWALPRAWLRAAAAGVLAVGFVGTRSTGSPTDALHFEDVAAAVAREARPGDAAFFRSGWEAKGLEWELFRAGKHLDLVVYAPPYPTRGPEPLEWRSPRRLLEDAPERVFAIGVVSAPGDERFDELGEQYEAVRTLVARGNVRAVLAERSGPGGTHPLSPPPPSP